MTSEKFYNVRNIFYDVRKNFYDIRKISMTSEKILTSEFFLKLENLQILIWAAEPHLQEKNTLPYIQAFSPPQARKNTEINSIKSIYQREIVKMLIYSDLFLDTHI